jgi:hypothetical protein
MKARMVILVAAFLIPVNFAVHDLKAQTKTKEQEQADLKLQQEIEQQKKAMVEMQKALDEQKKSSDEIFVPENDPNTSQGTRNIDLYDIRKSRSTGNDTFFNLQQLSDRYASGRTSWVFEKSITESTFSKDYGIDIDKGSKNVQLSISGTCKSGEIRVSIFMPGGKLFSEAVIDEFGNLNWRKSFQIADDNLDKIGEWKFKINAKNATGSFNISLLVN